MPRAVRRAGLAIMALHCEVMEIPLKTADPTLRLIRLKWWEDEIDKILSGKPHADSPVLEEIRCACPVSSQRTLGSQSMTAKDPSWSLYSTKVGCWNDRTQKLKDYFTAVDTLFHNQDQVDIGEALYALLGALIETPKDRARLSKILQYHDTLPDDAPFRAFRLWMKSL